MFTGEQLRGARAMLRLDQTDLAEKSGVSVETIKRLEKINGDLPAQYETLRKLADTFKLLGIEMIEYGDISEGGVGIRFSLSKAEQLETALTRAFEWGVGEALRTKMPGLREKTVDREMARDLFRQVLLWLQMNDHAVWKVVDEYFDDDFDF